ncbi:unnamed protein product [Podospora anserina S mat+]|uniref:Podospora anserina S mat+ genomic DNA chromosome 7, supercontig 1 n=1 Tax=Podospora anserina (strain S / ATCC MYA-4624 / DSM 980 / FGSC 10383) TaxID=515849 RepID=B2AVU8_PODAN|nr:unnamed protein product [Podospora anserina S mat+]CDP31997.1 Putative protein of unknown function [Podospora anserina S mat+]
MALSRLTQTIAKRPVLHLITQPQSGR